MKKKVLIVTSQIMVLGKLLLPRKEQFLYFRLGGPWELSALFGSEALRFHLFVLNYSADSHKFFLGGL